MHLNQPRDRQFFITCMHPAKKEVPRLALPVNVKLLLDR